MSYHNRGFQSAQELEDFLNGVILSSTPVAGPFSGAASLNGLTLVFDPGSGDVTVTFSGASLTLNQVVNQINAGGSGSAAGSANVRNYGRTPPYGSFLALVKSGLVLKNTGTANVLLGLPVATTTTVSAIDKGKLVFMEQDHNAHIFWLLFTD